MTTLNILVINCATRDSEVVDEAISVFRWAADAGPLGLEVRSVDLDATGRVPDSVCAAALHADAVLLGSWEPVMARRFSALRESLGVFATVQHQPKAAGQDVVVVRGTPGATPMRLRRTVEQAFHIAERRERTLAYAASPVPQREEIWAEVLADLTPRFPKVCVESHNPSKLFRRLEGHPADLDVVVTDLAIDGEPPRRSGPLAWLGQGGAMYAPAAVNSDGVGAKLIAAMRSAAMLLEYSAARYGLAESIRQAVDDVLPGAKRAPAGQMGQAVLDTLEARFEPCAGW
ncbi:MAG: hypothetical protein AAF799_17710 [Myxococcota bacterium]